MDITARFPQTVTFMDEIGEQIIQEVDLEGKLLKFDFFRISGHAMEDYRKRVKKVWATKEPIDLQFNPELPTMRLISLL